MRVRAVLAVLPLLALAACGGAATSGTSASDAASSAAPSSSAPPVTVGPAVPADTTVAEPLPAAEMPSVSGAFGDKPAVTLPAGVSAPASLQRQLLSEGTGKPSAIGDWLKVNYLGQTWGGKVFDNSYDRGAPTLVQLGAHKVVPGWEVGLTGVTKGSRVLLSLPPQDGYGAAGRAPDISGTDTLVFVIDVVDIIPVDAAGQADAAAQPAPAGFVSVTGDLGKEPTLTVPPTMAAPTAPKTAVLGKGTGIPVQAGDILVQYVVSSWDGTQKESSWPTGAAAGGSQPGPQELPVSASSQFAELMGVPLGSRVLVELPADATSGQPAIAFVFDLIAQADVTPATSATGSASSGASPTS